MDMLVGCSVNGETVLCWCQGEVLLVYKNESKPKVKVSWDAMPDVKGCEEVTESYAILIPRMWNPKEDCDGAWRLDVQVELGDEEDEGSKNDVEASGSNTERELYYGTNSSSENE